MRNAFKLFGEKDTGSFDQQFRRAHLLLTVLYVLVLTAVLGLSSQITHKVFSSMLDERFQPAHAYYAIWHNYLIPIPEPKDIRSDLEHALLLVDGLILLIAGLTSYVLAGWTLAPIKRMYEREQQFVSDASHELRTPLAILQTDLENALATNLNAKEQERAHSSLEEVKRMTDLVNSLLTLSKVHEQTTQIAARERIDLSQTTAARVKRLRTLAEKQHVTLSFVDLPQEPCYVSAPAEAVHRILDNVIKNAILYNKVHGRVNVTVKRQRKKAIVTVQDTGIGIAKKDLPRLFGRFWRADKSRSRQTGGSGLGLAIVRELTASLKGTVSIESTEQTGTTVTLSFPIHRSS